MPHERPFPDTPPVDGDDELTDAEKHGLNNIPPEVLEAMRKGGLIDTDNNDGGDMDGPTNPPSEFRPDRF